MENKHLKRRNSIFHKTLMKHLLAIFFLVPLVAFGQTTTPAMLGANQTFAAANAFTGNNTTIDTLRLGSTPGLTPHVMTTMTRTTAKILAQAAPVRVAIVGDSIASGLGLPSNWGNAGQISGAAPTAVTGNNSFEEYSSNWFNGRVQHLGIGATANYTRGGQSRTLATSRIIGDRVAVYYLRGPSQGNFTVGVSTGGNFTVVGNVTATHGTIAGGAAEFTISASQSPAYDMQINNVADANATIVGWGIYKSDGVGVIPIDGMFNQGGIDISVGNATTDAIMSPIWTALAPTLVLSSWAERESTDWAPGGHWPSWVTRRQADVAATDWVIIAANPISGEENTQWLGRKMQYEWAVAARQSYFDGYSMFGNYATANASGFMADPVHLSGAGLRVRNAVLWNTLPVARYNNGAVPLTGLPAVGHYDPSFNPAFSLVGSRNLSGQLIRSSHAMQIGGSMELVPPASFSTGLRWRLSLDLVNNRLVVGIPGGDIVNFRMSSSAGMWPGSDGFVLGGSGLGWDLWARRLRVRQGSGGSAGNATLTAGNATVSTTFVPANSVIHLTRRSAGNSTALGSLTVGTITADTSFTISSLSANASVETGDNSTVNWTVMGP